MSAVITGSKVIVLCYKQAQQYLLNNKTDSYIVLKYFDIRYLSRLKLCKYKLLPLGKQWRSAVWLKGSGLHVVGCEKL